ncbi:MAG: lysophospholipid acyltransferase family protein [Candidatus Erginobacter occultus]|nr:lysophospholipid acyltransferase family protein [Candidatus Erginobacter occultus]
MIINRVLQRFRIWISYVALVLTGFVCFAFFRFPLNFMRVRGKVHVPKRGKKVLFVSNHLSMYDSFLIAVAAFFPSIFTRPSRPPVNFAAEENFFTRWYVRILLKLLKTVPVKKGRNDPFLMRKYSEFLEKRNILIFYQGTRSFNLKQIKFGPGYVIANSEEELTVIPVYHEGITRIFSRGGPKTRGIWRWLPRSLFHRTTVSFGPPITFEDLMGIENQRERIEAINERIIYRIEELQAASAGPAAEGSG